MLRCVYCGEQATEPPRSCCGEIHFEDSVGCPECGSEFTYRAHQDASPATPECSSWNCEECGHEWDIG